MSNQGKLGNLSQAEKSIKEKHGPDNKEAANAPDEKDGKQEESGEQSESGNK